MRLRVAGAQMPVDSDVGRNAEVILRAVDFAISERADVLLTPEGSLSGYSSKFDTGAVCEAIDAIVARARVGALALTLGTCFVEPGDGAAYNELRFYDNTGAFLGAHAKILRCAPLEGEPRGEICDFGSMPLRTFYLGGVCVGGLICNDLWANPMCTPMPDAHLTQQLSQMGARIIFHAVNGGRSDSDISRVCWHYHEANLLMRAQAGRVWIVTADNSAPHSLPCSAPCGVVTPEGAWAMKTEAKGEQFFAHTIESEG